MTGEIAIIGNGESALALKAGGVDAFFADDEKEARELLKKLARTYKVIFVTEDLAEKMDWWLEHPQERQQCARDYLGYAHQFDFDTCMDAMEQMLKDAVEAKHHGA